MSSRDIANLKNGLVAAWIPSLGSTGYRLVDRVGSNHGVLTNMDAGTDWVVSNGNIALDFDGTDDFVDLGGSQIPLAGLQRISFSAWVYVTSLSNRIMPIGRYVNNTSLGANRRGDGFFTVNYTTPGQVYLGIQAATAGGTDYIEYYSTQTITANAWNHIAAAVFINGNSSSGNIWINGKLATTNIVYSGTPPTSYPSNVATGIYTINRFIPGSGTPVYLGGRVDDVRLYNRNLTSSEVQLLASKRGIGLQSTPRHTDYLETREKTYSVIVKSQQEHSSLSEGLVGAWCPSLGATGYRLVDRSGYGNHLPLVGMSTDNWVSETNGISLTTTTGQYSLGEQNAIGNFNGEFTALAWIKPVGTQAVDYSPFSKFADVLSGPWMIWIEGGKVKAYWGGTRATGVTTVSTAGVWQLVAISFNDGNAQSWYNGKLDASASSIAPNTTGTGRIMIGSYATSLDRALRGSVGECLIYNRALTEAEHFRLYSGGRQLLKQLFQQTKKSTYYQFPSGSKRRRILTGMT